MSRLIKRGTSVNGGIRPISYGAEIVGSVQSGFDNPVKFESKPPELKIAEEIKAQAYREAMQQAENDINILLEKKTAELEEKFLREVEQIQKEYADKISRLQGIMLAIESQGKEYITNLEPFVVTLTMHALHKLTGKKEIFEVLIKEIIAHAIGNLESGQKITVKLSEQDKQYLSTDGNPLKDMAENIIFDDSLPPGSCMIESSNTTVNASLPNALNGIQSALTTEIEKK